MAILVAFFLKKVGLHLLRLQHFYVIVWYNIMIESLKIVYKNYFEAISRERLKRVLKNLSQSWTLEEKYALLFVKKHDKRD